MFVLLFYFLLMSVVVFLLSVIARKDVARMVRSYRRDPAEHVRSSVSLQEEATRVLLGDDVYEKMVKNVDDVLKRHENDRSQSFALSSGPVSEEGWRALHKLLPGDALNLAVKSEDGITSVDVAADDVVIGRLLLTAADMAADIISNKKVTGVYVAEQNSYGDSDVVMMRIILFFSASERESRKPLPVLKGLLSLPGFNIPGKLAKDSIAQIKLPSDLGPFNFYQN